MTWTKAQLPRPTTDFILVGEVGLAALGSEVALVDNGQALIADSRGRLLRMT